MRVLYVATDLRDADILQQEVRRVAPGLTMEICAGVSELRARPEQSTPADVLLMDCSLSEAEQLQLIHYSRVRQLAVPVVGVMGTNASMPSAALSAGLDDLLVRGPKFADRLQPALRLSTDRYRTISHTVRENDKLKKSEARLRLIIEALPTGVVLFDQAGKILAMNTAGVQLFGALSPQDVVGRAFATLIPVEDQPAFQEFLKKVAGGEEGGFQFSSLHDEGETPRVYGLRGLCIQREDAAGQHGILAVVDRLQTTNGVAHTWTSDFNLEVTGLTPPMLDVVPDLVDAQARVAELEAQSAQAQTRISELERDTAQARARIADLDAHVRAAQGKAGEWEAQAGAAHGRASELDARAQAAERRIAELDALVSRLRDEHAAADARAAETHQHLTHAQQQQHAHASEIDALRQALASEQEQRKAAEARVQATAASAADDLAKQTDALASLAGELESARGEVVTLTEGLAREREAKEQAHASLAHAQQHAASDAETLRAEVASLTHQLAQTRGAHDALQAAHETLRSGHDSLHAAHVDLQTTTAQQSAQQQGAAAELETVRGELALAVAALAAQRAEHERLQATLVQKDAHLLDLEQRAQARMRALEQEHRVAVNRLQELLDQAARDSQALGGVGARGGAAADSARRGAERVGRLAAAMAVDLNGAAESAMEAARAVLAAAPPGSPAHDSAQKTLETVQRCAELSRHLLRTSTRYMGQATRIDVSHVVQQHEMLLHHLAGPDIDVQFELAAGLTSIELDSQDLTQVLTSLTVTARDALPLGGAIRISTAMQRSESAEGAHVDHPRPLVLAVAARGYGIRPVSSATCEDVTARCGGLLTTVIEPNVSWTLMAMLPGGLASDAEVVQDLTRSA